MDHTQYQENGGGGEAAALHFVHIYYGPTVASTVGCTWLMFSLCMAHIWPMHDLYMALRSNMPSYTAEIFEHAQMAFSKHGIAATSEV